MKTLLISILMSLLSISSMASEKGIYDFKVKLTNGEELNLKDYKGSPFMIVNIATRCGYTGQLDDLEKLYQKFKDKGFKMVGIPSNDFGGQTPEGNKEVADFCRLKYGATFPIAEKTVVKGDEKTALIKWLTSKEGEISWNFEKFLISKEGTLVKRFKSGNEPLSKDIVQQIEESIK